MLYLLLSVFFTSLVFLILKEFNRFQIDNFQAIVVNYFIAFFIGSWFANSPVNLDLYINQAWTVGAICISLIFIITFNLMAITAQKGGLSVMTIANKMSVVIPILIGVVLYKENLGAIRFTGIIVALLGVWFTSKKQDVSKLDKRFWYLPLLIFIGSGVADSLINHIQLFYVSQNSLAVFSTSLFLFCGLLGVLVCVVKFVTIGLKFTLKNIIGGVVLGVPNYFSIYYLLKALSQPNYESSFIFSINNLLVVLLSVILGVLLYKEKLSKQNYVGIVMSILAIVFLYIGV